MTHVDEPKSDPLIDQPPPNRSILRSVWRALIGLLLGAMLLLLWTQLTMAILASLDPRLELACHFLFQGMLVGAIAVGVAWLFRWRAAKWAAAIPLVVFLYWVQPWTLYLTRPPQALSEQLSVRVLSWNILSTNHALPEAAELIRREDPDVLILIETRPNLFDKELAFIERKYPFAMKNLNWGGSGMCVFSRVPNTELRWENFGFEGRPAILARIPNPKTEAWGNLVAIHPLSPLPSYRAVIRDQQLENIRQWAIGIEEPICMCGDFNSTPWGCAFSKLLRAGFSDSRHGTGNAPTWHQGFGPLAIPIDHVLTKGDCLVTERQVLATAPGSDHLPIRFTLHF